MIDIGLYNYIKNAFAQGKNTDEVKETLLKAGWTEKDIDSGIAAVRNPSSPMATMVKSQAGSSSNVSYSFERPSIIAVICGYFFITWIKFFISFVVTWGTLLYNGASISLSSINFNITSANIVPLGIAVLSVLAVLGYWSMKRWGLYAECVAVVASLVSLIIQTGGTMTSGMWLSLAIALWLPLFTIIVGFMYFDQMS